MTHKTDIYGNPLVVVKCVHCRKIIGYHKAKTYECPEGRKHRTFGYAFYSQSQVFTAPKERPC